MLEPQQLQQSLQIREVELLFDGAGCGGGQVPVRQGVPGPPHSTQVLVEIRFLVCQPRRDPLLKDLLVAVAQGPVGVVGAPQIYQ
jgi:hypothetical protein